MRGEPREARDSLLYRLGRDGRILRNLSVTEGHQVFIVVTEDLDGKLGKVVIGQRLDQEAFLQVAGADTARLERLQHRDALGHRQARRFQREFVPQHAFDFDDKAIVVGKALRHGAFVGTLEEAVLVERIDEVFHQFAESLFRTARLQKLVHQFARAVPFAQLVQKPILQARIAVLLRAVPSFVRVRSRVVQILERSVHVARAIFEALRPIFARRILVDIVIRVGAVLERPALKVHLLARAFIGILGVVRFVLRRIGRDFVGNIVVEFQQRVAFDFLLDSRLEFEGILLQYRNGLEHLRRDSLL